MAAASDSAAAEDCRGPAGAAGCGGETTGTGMVTDMRPLFLPLARSSTWTTRGSSAGSTIPCHSRVSTRVTPEPGPASLPTDPRPFSHSSMDERTRSRTFGRCSGSAASADSSSGRISSAMPSRSGARDPTRWATSSGEPVPNGGRPVPAKARTAPQANTSEAALGASPRRRSGLDQGVDTGGTDASPDSEQSRTRGPAELSSTLPGLRSPCTRSRECSADSPSPSPAASAVSRPRLMGPRWRAYRSNGTPGA